MATFRLPNVLNDVIRAHRDQFLRPVKPKNGVGAFVFPCRKLVFNYCERSGSSKSMAEYLQTEAVRFAKENPQIEVVVQPRPSKHPIIRAFYTNGEQKTKCVRKCLTDEIPEVVKSLRDHSGHRLRRWNRYVISDTPSVRGIYSPFHDKNTYTISDLKTKR
ncbi:39S ribosomal protein L51, mitochondrial [Coemansia thaxteri]|uniref:Large ribosomal subunit protein mL43 n=1 Tax=Coemansia thaxteri TaxID=2663907 RepID=A0A9W8BI73_9FUNG|nr:39S ribosomal protein L51, mitochondrial [Coemansia thaxteri]KAJ2006025.1 39S ribosomal protein L51, mitochondrial [Coemansia thaxteri]KAJ2469134.1 39S ribosomal protein L51, mitochondrial [Coemansia sp. RSA 2322]KAJ2486107.1 39S ribosomal protein L51, mitochondrial [Coemansia sp. RSA 2320]